MIFQDAAIRSIRFENLNSFLKIQIFQFSDDTGDEWLQCHGTIHELDIFLIIKKNKNEKIF